MSFPSSEILSFPPPVAQIPEYLSNADKAERASSNISPQSTFSSTSSTAYTKKGLFPKKAKDSSNEVKRIRNPLTWYRTQKEERRQLYGCFIHEEVETHPKGYPQLAAFLNSDEDFAILRRFGTVNCRVLLHLQAEIADLEKQLTDLDDSDAYEGSKTSYRLVTVKHEEGWDTRQRDILKCLQEKLTIYYDLVFKDTQMRALGKPLKRNHKSLFHWICSAKPVAQGEDDWVLNREDLVPLSKIDRFESSLASSFINKLFTSSPSTSSTDPPSITYYSQARLSFTAKLLSVLVTVSILTIPVLILLWTSLSRVSTSITVLISVMVFSTMLCLFTSIRVQEILVGTAAYCAVLVSILGNLQQSGAKGS